MADKQKYPVAHIPVDNGLWEVPSEPVQSQSGMSGNFTTTRVSRSDDDIFELAPSFGAYLFGFGFLCFGAFLLTMLVRALLLGEAPVPLPAEIGPVVGMIAGCLFGAFFGFMAIVMSLILMTQTTRFDRTAGTMTRRVLFRTRSELPLADIVAVQCLYVGHFSTKGNSYDVFQLNLVVATGNEPRIVLCSGPSEFWIRQTAESLADFLGVHLLDQIAQTKAVWEANQFKFKFW